MQPSWSGCAKDVFVRFEPMILCFDETMRDVSSRVFLAEEETVYGGMQNYQCGERQK